MPNKSLISKLLIGLIAFTATFAIISYENEKFEEADQFAELQYYDLPQLILNPVKESKLDFYGKVESLIEQLSDVDCDRIRENELVCLACNIYHEARNQPREGQIAVANVTLNRVKSPRFPNSICQVVWEYKQFSWTWDGKSDKIYEMKPWRKAIELSVMFLYGDRYNQTVEDNTNGALWYHANYVDPYWRVAMNVTVVHGEHIFYNLGQRIRNLSH